MLLQTKQTTGSGVDLKVHTTSYTYNASTGRLDSLTYPSGNVLAYTYDVQGRINSIAVNGFSLVGSISYPYTATGTVNLSYDLGDRVNSMSGAVAKTYAYDKLDRLTVSVPPGHLEFCRSIAHTHLL